MTALELVESIRMPRRYHWEDHYQYDFAGRQQRRWEQDNALAAIQHLYASDDDSGTVINEGNGETISSDDEGCSTNASVNNNNNGEDDSSQHENSNHDDNEVVDENMDLPDDDAGIGVSYQVM
jgi:hypothetical protein